jgi:LacI family transcriptional regulator
MNCRITQKDLARALGVDKSTVSLALRNHPSIPATTRKRVKTAAKEMGYRPDPALATLARHRWAGHPTGHDSAFAYIVDSRMNNYDGHRRFYQGCLERAHERGYRIQEFDLGQYPSPESVSRVLYHRGIRGLLIPQLARSPSPNIRHLPANQFTVVCLDQGWIEVPYHLVAQDIFAETRRVWRTVLERGYRRIGGAILNHCPPALDDAARIGASMASQHEWLSPEERIPLLLSSPDDKESFFRWMNEHKPDVVIGFVSRVKHWLIEGGWRVPEDVAFAGLIIVPHQNPEICGCVAQGDNIGRAGVDALISSIGEGEWGIPTQQRKLILQPIWNEGSTLPPHKDHIPSRLLDLPHPAQTSL